MTSEKPTFRHILLSSRKALKLSQKELAEGIFKKDGTSITSQYLSDIKHDRRNPSSGTSTSDHFIEQVCAALDIDADYLFFLVGRFPADIKQMNISPKAVARAMAILRKS